MTIIETAKLDGLDPQAYLADILNRIHKAATAFLWLVRFFKAIAQSLRD